MASPRPDHPPFADGRKAPTGDPREPGPEHRGFRLVWWLVLGAAMLLFVNYWTAGRLVERRPPQVRVPYSPFFLGQLQEGNVASITSTGATIEGTFARAVRYPASAPRASRRFKTQVPAFADRGALFNALRTHRVVINAEPPSTGTPWWQVFLLSFGPTLLLIALLFLLLRRLGSAGGMLTAFGQARARRYRASAERVSFADVAGIDEAKEELNEVVDFLKDPDKYRRLGARIPRGVLLNGPPGTGKTLLARAVAGEAGVPFFSLSASEFVEMFVGVGASRVRDLFIQAKQAAPAIIFIDELDAIGRSRMHVAGMPGHDEREQTLNQILAEMDGFDPSTGVIVLAATNRPDVLDPALLRPGRFDRRIAVQPPDTRGRELILQVHARPVPLADDVDLHALATQTPGMVGADLANLVNEAALVAARRGHDRVATDDFGTALERILLGAERKIMLDPDDRRRSAYHEAGHAVVAMNTPGADPVRKVSIIPRGVALGVTFAAPSADRFSYPESYLLAKIKVALGGRAADELVFGERTTGAELDLRELTDLARHMAGRFGMSDRIGPIVLLPSEGERPAWAGAADVSEHQQRLLDDEVRRVVDAAHEEARQLLADHREQLDALAEALLERETLDEAEAYAAAGSEPPTEREPAPAGDARRHAA